VPPRRVFSDFFVAAQAGKIKPDPDIVVVAADEHSLEQLAISQAAGRGRAPCMVKWCKASKRRSRAPIVFDVMFFSRTSSVLTPTSCSTKRGALQQCLFSDVRQDPAGDPYGVPIAEMQAALGAFAGPQADKNATLKRRIPKALTPENWRLGTNRFPCRSGRIGAATSSTRMPTAGKFLRCRHGWAQDSAWPCRTSDHPAQLAWRQSRPPACVVFGSVHRLQQPEAQARPERVQGQDRHHRRGPPAGCMTYDRRGGVVVRRIDILAGALDNLKNKNYLRPVPAAWPVVMALALLVLLYAGFRMQLHTLKSVARC